MDEYKEANWVERGGKHGACELYVQNPQGIAVNSFLFEENLQLEVGSSRRLRDCGVRSGLGSRPASSPTPPLLAGAASGAGGEPGGGARKESRAPSPPPALTPPAGSCRPAAVAAAPRFRPSSLSDTSRCWPPGMRATRQRLMDYCSLPGRPPPPAWQLPRLRAYKCRCLVPGAAIGK
ncbi:translation initiation factor IF-2-like [Dipodomys spectabilis]|uniref:translation initiation factor IF-2-like n=1 Tax=Dipodomys spectabilis TaxID=105255 RepID=UPI001C54666B|nr:translation initiation factor IF-2-like [Dipodomys spectabilis]